MDNKDDKVNLEMIRFFLIVIVLLSVSCSDRRKISGKNKTWLIGTIINNKGQVDTIRLQHCYCKLVKSKIILEYPFFGMEGGNLTTTIDRDSIDLDLVYWPNRFNSFSFNKKNVIINNLNPAIGETIFGEVSFEGQEKDNDDDINKFNFEGEFKCVLKDSTYDFPTFYNDLRDYYDSIKMFKLKSIAYRNPDSVSDLQLNYKHFNILENDFSLFKNLQRLSLSNFPSLDSEMILHLKFLRELSIDSDHHFKELPENIGELKNLEELNISAPITRIPNSLFTLTKLRELDLGATNISKLSSRIKDLRLLEKLNISYTKIRTIPMELFELGKLNDLSLPDTIVFFKIKKLNLKSLKTLSVSYEFLMYNREDIQKLRDLDWLYPSFVYKTNNEYMSKHFKREQYLEALLPNVSISGVESIIDDEY